MDEAAPPPAAVFFDELYPAGVPDGLSVLTWDAATKKSKWWFDLEKAASACSGDRDVYVGCALAPKGLGVKQRCTAGQAKGIPGVWLDVDVKDGTAHKAENLPATKDEATTVFPLPPTIVVDSGHGLQGWWLFKEPWIFESDADRKQAEELLGRWHLACDVRAKERKWRLDNTSDLARILRLPGTINAKAEPVNVVIVTSDGPRYDLDHLQDFVAPFKLNGVHQSNGVHNNFHEDTNWNKVFAGVGEGERHNAALKFIGLTLCSMKDVTDNRQVALARFQVEAWNRLNSPPIDDPELKRIFNDLLRKERDKAIDGAFEAAMGQYAPIDAIPTPAVVGETKEVERDGATWKLVTINSEPKSYRLYGPMWPGKFVLLTSDQMVNPRAICREALEQVAAAVPATSFTKAWNGNPKKDDRGLFSLLVEGSTFEDAPRETVRTAYVASLVRQYLEEANSSLEDEKEQFRRVLAGEGAVKFGDGSVAFHFNDLLARLHDKPNRPTNNELSAVLAKSGIGTQRKKSGDIRGVFKVATSQSIEALERLSGYLEDDQ